MYNVILYFINLVKGLCDYKKFKNSCKTAFSKIRLNIEIQLTSQTI